MLTTKCSVYDCTDILNLGSGGDLLFVRQSAVTNTNSINTVSYGKSSGLRKNH